MPVRRPTMLLAALTVAATTALTGAGPLAAAQAAPSGQVRQLAAVASAPCPADKGEQRITKARADARAARAAAKRAQVGARAAAAKARAQGGDRAAQTASRVADRAARQAASRAAALDTAASKAARAVRAKQGRSCATW